MKMIRKQTNHVLEVSVVILKGRKVCIQEECPAKCVLVFQVAILRIRHLTYTHVVLRKRYTVYRPHTLLSSYHF